MLTLLDANAVLRHLLDDIPEQADRTAQAVEAGAEVTPEVIAECVYVLKGVYDLSKAELAQALVAFLHEVACERKPIIIDALESFANTNLDFVDCILLSMNKLTDQPVLTFDKKLSSQMIK